MHALVYLRISNCLHIFSPFLTLPSWQNGCTALSIATRNGDASIVKLLLAHGADKEATDNVSRFAMHIFVRWEETDSLRRCRYPIFVCALGAFSWLYSLWVNRYHARTCLSENLELSSHFLSVPDIAIMTGWLDSALDCSTSRTRRYCKTPPCTWRWWRG